MIWNAVIFGPHDTPFEDGTFKLTIEFTEEYPNKPPTVRFVSKMFHPNVYADGGICLDILQNRWSPTYDVSAILTSIQVSSSAIFPESTLIEYFFSHFWAIRILTRRQTLWRLSCTKKIAANTRNGWRRAWNRASSISWIECVCVNVLRCDHDPPDLRDLRLKFHYFLLVLRSSTKNLRMI